MKIRTPRSALLAEKHIDEYWELLDAKKGIFRSAERKEKILAKYARQRRWRANS